MPRRVYSADVLCGVLRSRTTCGTDEPWCPNVVLGSGVRLWLRLEPVETTLRTSSDNCLP